MTQEEEAKQTLDELRRGTRRRWLSHMGSAILFSVALICGAVGLIYSYGGAGISGGTMWMLLMVVGFVAAAYRVYRNMRTEPDVLNRHMDVSAIGALIERMDVSFGSERRAVTRVLIRLLGQVEATDGPRFSRTDRVRLDDALRVPDFLKNADLLSAIVRAYEKIGNDQSLDLVQTLATQKGEIGPERQVRDAARSVLPELANRVAKQRAGKQLLRASTAATSTDTLLRASTESPESQPSELLRAGVSPGDHKPE